MRYRSICGALAVSGGILASAAFAQPQQPGTSEFEAPPTSPAPYEPDWTDDEIGRAATMLAGTWVSEAPMAAMGDGAPARVVFSIAPAPVTGLRDTLYVEAAREDALDRPFRHAVFQFYRYKDGVRMRTLEIATPPGARDMLAGMWAAPEWFPSVIDGGYLVATEDLDLTMTATGFSGRTPYPFPTMVGGAVEMTGSFEVTPDRVTVHDRGYGPDGELVWGETPTAFVRTEPFASVTRHDSGVVIIDFTNPGEPVNERDRLHVRYTGWRIDTSLFDSNRDEGDPAFIFAYPPLQRLIAGWTPGTEGASVGTKRKLIIPWDQAYGERGNPRAGIGPHEPLVFEIEVVHIDRYVPPEEQPQAEPAETPAGGGEDE